MEAFSRVGTPLYMSPEVLQGSGYDFQCDVWSLGCIGYEFCALKNPFKDETKKMSLYDLFSLIIKADYVPLSSSRYSAELLYIIDSMLIVNPDERVNINDVVTYCTKQIEIMDKKYREINGGHSRNPSALETANKDSTLLSSDDRDSRNATPIAKKFGVDPCLVMDDIIEKLQLLEYQT